MAATGNKMPRWGCDSHQLGWKGKSGPLSPPGSMLPRSFSPYHGVDESGTLPLRQPTVPRANMRFVPVKTEDQQARPMVHRARQGYVAARTATLVQGFAHGHLAPQLHGSRS